MLLAIAVIICSILYSIVLSHPIPQTPPKVTLVGTVIGNNITIEHRGGDDLSLDTKIILKFNQSNQVYPFTVRQGLDYNSLKDGKWNVGEQFKQSFENLPNFNYNENSTEAEVKVIDPNSNTMVMVGTLDIHPEADLGVKITVNNTYPYNNTLVKITITVTNYRCDLNKTTGVQIQYILPTDLTYYSNTSSQGIYNKTGIWNVGTLQKHGSATLIITARVTAKGHSAPTQLVCILDGSESVANNWSTFTQGLAEAIKSNIFPHDGSVELTLIQFGGDTSVPANAKIECNGPSIVTASNYTNIANKIWNGTPQIIRFSDSYTPLSCAIRRTNDFLISSANYPNYKHVICLLTDGAPNCKGYIYPINSDTRRWKILTEGLNSADYKNGRTDAEVAQTETITNVLKQKDELDTLLVHTSTTYGEPSFSNNTNWLKQKIVWPGKNQWFVNQTAPPNPGWVRIVNSWSDFPQTIKAMFNVIFNGITNTVTITHSNLDDPDTVNNQDPLPIIMPHI